MFRRVFLVLVLMAAAGLALDMLVHPKVYFGRSHPRATHPVVFPTSPSVTPASIPTLEPTPTPEWRVGPAEVLEVTGAEELSSLTLEEAGGALREGRLAEVSGARIAWVFVDCSIFHVLVEKPGVQGASAFLPVRDASGSWFAIEANGIIATGAPDEIRGHLSRGACRVEGRLDGALADGFIGPGWHERKAMPKVADVRLSFLPWTRPTGRSSGRDNPTPISPPSPTPTWTPPGPIPSGGARREDSASPEPIPPRYEIQLVPERERAGAHAAGREFAWSLRHTLYENDGWILDEREYRMVEEWDRAIRSRYQTFEGPKDRQAIVREFVQLLGEEKAMHAGILFNDNRGLPMYRWPPAGARLPPLVPVEAAPRTSATGAGIPSPPHGAAEDRREEAAAAPDVGIAPRKTSGDPSTQGPIEKQVLEFLLETSEQTSSILLETPGGVRAMVRPLSRGDAISLGEKGNRFSGLTKLLENLARESVILRLKYPLFDRIALKFGPPDRRRSSPYPREPKLSRTSLGGKAAPNPPASLVWEEYGAVEVSRAKRDEEPDPLADKMVLVRIDAAKWKQVRR